MSNSQYDDLLEVDNIEDRERGPNANYPKVLLNHDEDIAVLLDMGFEEAMIQKVFIIS